MGPDTVLLCGEYVGVLAQTFIDLNALLKTDQRKRSVCRVSYVPFIRCNVSRSFAYRLQVPLSLLLT